jgi:hypothetical protein
MGTYSLLIGPSQTHLEQEGEKKLEKEEEKNLENEEEEEEREEQSPKNMSVLTDEKTTGTVTIKIGDRDIKKEEEKAKDTDTKLLCAEPEAWCGGTRRNESAGESEPEVEEVEGGRSEVRPTCQQQGNIPAAGGGVQATAAEILPPEYSAPAALLPPAAVELGKSATTDTAEGPLSVAEVRLAATTLRQASE